MYTLYVQCDFLHYLVYYVELENINGHVPGDKASWRQVDVTEKSSRKALRMQQKLQWWTTKICKPPF